MALHIPLPLLLGSVVVGVALVVVLSRALGGASRAHLADNAAVVGALAEEAPGVEPGAVFRSEDGRAGLVELGDGVGIVGTLGDGLWVRWLRRGSVGRVAVQGGGLRVRVRDPGLPPVDLTMPDAADRAAWAARLEALA